MDLLEDITKNSYSFETGSYNESFTKANKTIVVFCYWNKGVEVMLNKMLNRFLFHLNRLYLKDIVYAVIKENIINSVKANMKRVYFEKARLNIHNADEYEKGMENFKSDMIKNLDEYEQSLIDKQMFVKTKFWYNSTHFMVTVESKSMLLPQERDRIDERLRKAEEIEDLAEVFISDMDETEGAGLGLLLMACLLKNEGFNLSNFFIHSEVDFTESGLRVPFLSEKQNQNNKEIIQKIMNHVDALPTFPQSIASIQLLIESETSSLESIAQAIRTDVAVASQVLKLANSDLFNQAAKVETLERAVQLIGKEGLREMLFTIGAREIMQDQYDHFEEIWKRSNESALIATQIAMKQGATIRQISLISLGALLQDIGLVVLFSIKSDVLKPIGRMVDMKQLPASIHLEEAMIGISHATVGSLISNQWFLPNIVAMVLEYHHLPFLVAEKDKRIIFPIYLANMIIEYNRGIENTYQIEPDVLDFFKYTYDDFLELAKEMKELLRGSAS